jgi:hypothetical protein
MNQITKIIKEREEKFDEKFEVHFPVMGTHGHTYALIKSHNKATIFAVLEALEEEVKGMKTEEGHSLAESLSYNQSLSDTLSLITLTKQEIK